MRAQSIFVWFAVFAVVTSLPLAAQQAPEVGYVWPPAVQRGTTASVQLGGFDWTPDTQVFVHSPGLELKRSGPPSPVLVPAPPYWFGPKSFTPSSPLPRQWPAQVTVAATAVRGCIDWQAANANGISKLGRLYVGDEPVFTEDESRRDPQPIGALPRMLCGRLLCIEEVDHYVVSRPTAGPISLELFARRLGSDLLPLVKVYDQNQLVAQLSDTAGRDGALSFAAAAGRPYEVRLHDVDFTGNEAYVYAVRVTAGPHVVATLPALLTAGQTQEVEFVGYGLETGTAELQRVKRSIAVPAAADANQPPAPIEYVLETPLGNSSPLMLPVSNLPEQLETATPTWPGAVTGTLATKDERDRFPLEGKRGEIWQIALQARRFNSPLDTSLRVIDAKGKEVARNDDLAGTTDSALSFKLPADGLYTVEVFDLAGTSGSPAATYRLSVERPRPEFTLELPQAIRVLAGAETPVTVKAIRQPEFLNPIHLEITGLPPGVTVPEGLVIPTGKNELKFSLTAKADAATQAGPIQIIGRAEFLGQTVVRKAEAVGTSTSLCTRDLCELRRADCMVATCFKPPFKFHPVDKDGGRTVHRGTTFPAAVQIERDPGFVEPLELQMSSSQDRHRQGISGPDLPVGANVDVIAYPCYMPEWLETTRTARMNLIGVAQVKDGQGQLRYAVQLMEGRITMSLEGALLKLSHGAPELEAKPGDTVSIPVRVFRSPKLQLPVQIEVRPPADRQGLFAAQTVTLPPGEDAITIAVRSVEHAKLKGELPITLRATAWPAPDLPVISEVDVPVWWEAAK